MNTERWNPRCALRVGVVGNRHFVKGKDPQALAIAGRMREHAAGALEAVWQEILSGIDSVLEYRLPGVEGRGERTMREIFAARPPRLSVLSSLAAGADQIGASTALHAAKKHEGIEVELEALLPFRQEDYPGPVTKPRPEFNEDEARTLSELAAQACQVVRLPGDYRTDESCNQAYEGVRDLLLQNSDVLIAVYNPENTARKAGTVETVRHALRQEIPVVAILLEEGEARIQVVRHADSAGSPIQWQAALPVDAAGWRTTLQQCLSEQLLIPELLQVHEEHGERNLKHALYRLDMMSGESEPPAICTNRFAAAIFTGVWAGLQKLALAIAHHRPAEGPRKEPIADDSITMKPYTVVYHRASKLAVDYIRTYRGAFVSSYLLAGVAVAAAVAIMTVSMLTGGKDEAHTGVILALCAVKIGVLLLMLLLEREGHKGRFQEAGADFRYLAELLRPMQWLTPVGAYPPAVTLPLQAGPHDPRRKWMAWLARATARATPCVARYAEDQECVRELAIATEDLAATLDHARAQWVEGQIVYHRRAASRMHALEDGLERLGRWLLWSVLAAAVTACTLEVLHRYLHAETLSVILGSVAAFLPAWIAAFAGIAFQSEAKRLAGRSDAMVDALALHRNELVASAERIRSGGAANSRALSQTTSLLEKVSTITIGEAGEWKVLYQTHVIHAG